MKTSERAALLLRLRPVIRDFGEVAAIERARGANRQTIEAMIEYAVESSAPFTEADVREILARELAEVAFSTHSLPTTKHRA